MTEPKTKLPTITPPPSQVIEYTGNATFNALVDAVKTGEIDADTVDRLISANERIMAKQAEIEFNQALSRLQPKLPTIEKKAKGHNSKYAKYDEIDKQIRPLYTAEGFSVSFNSRRNADNTTTYIGTLSHAAGHSRTAEMILPSDTSGSKNAIQAVGSTSSYAQRYLVTMLLNLVFKDEDDDGHKGGSRTVSDEQAKQLNDILDHFGTDRAKALKGFLKFMGAESVDAITARDFDKAINALKSKESERKKPEGESDAHI